MHRVTELLKDSSERTLFTRMSWAPDGLSLCVTSSSKSLKPVSCVLKRDTWESVADLVGHQVETMSCRFLPNILHHSITRKSSKPKTGSAIDSAMITRKEPSCFVAVGDLQVSLAYL